MILQLRLELVGSEPSIWRRTLVEDTGTLHALHRIIQLLMGWWDYHLYEFEVKGRRFHGPGDEPEFEGEDFGEEAAEVTLRALGLRKGDAFLYRYDFGDGWEIAIDVEWRRQAGGRGWVLPALLDGARAGPPEDCGGIGGLDEILEALEPIGSENARNGNGRGAARAAGRGDDEIDESVLDEAMYDEDLDDEDLDEEEERRRELLAWLGDYDPARFDLRTVNHVIGLVAAWGGLEP